MPPPEIVEYETLVVKELLSHEMRPSGIRYLVKLVGLEEEEYHQWVLAEELDTPRLIRQYWQKLAEEK